LRVVDAERRHRDRWDEEIDASINGTLFHRLDFLAYHGGRFAENERHLVLLDGEEAVARLSMTIEDADGRRTARSPYGGSYGSFAFRSVPTYSKSRATVDALIEFLITNDVDRLVLTPPIACCSNRSLDTFTFALLESGFTSASRDVSSVVSLGDGPISVIASSRARYAARKAESTGVTVVHDPPIDAFWSVMKSGYIDRGRVPTHTRDELEQLTATFPRRVRLDLAYLGHEPVAGMASFAITATVDSSFYLCQDPIHSRTQGLSLLILQCLSRSQSEGFTYFDFGTSTAAMEARPALFQFKESFGATGMFRETFEWVRT